MGELLAQFAFVWDLERNCGAGRLAAYGFYLPYTVTDQGGSGRKLPDKEFLSSRLEAEAMRRIKEAIRIRGGAQRVAEITGIPLGTLNKNLSGQTKASFSTVMAIIEGLEIEPALIFPSPKPPVKTSELRQRAHEAFRAKQERMRIADAASLEHPLQEPVGLGVFGPDELDQPGMISIPRYDEVRPSAGPGAVAISDVPTTRVAFEKHWLTEIGVQTASAVILPAQGDSMEPTIANGSPMLVDTSKTEIQNGFIYVIAVENDLLVKRVRRRLDGRIDLISDNRAYDTETLDAAALQQLRVIGRVYAAVSKF
ncbi:LexA family transcriptional regulator [Gemmobacter sp.]|uniref:LexA family transcriptional regulator n=1 Tax=Gemmobacter sp. TaxID=1898957 RepID=UPI002AFDE2F1|nr:LexA family transcriptional regulator [Gemmobacter sp.]